MRVPERLVPLVEDGLVQEVVQPLMSGKEAQLFVVHANGVYCVAKVYKDAAHRSFRHRAGYAEGRRVRNSRQRRAMEKGTKYGKEQLEAAWQNAEVEALFRLAEQGLRVPRPHQYVDGVLLMDLILDQDGDPAPRLFDIDLTEEQALEVHQFLIRQVVGMLCAGLVHGDLSECNVLIAWDGPVIIDLPQATDAAHNPNAMALFIRDVDNLTRYLSRFAPELADTKYGNEIWALYQRGELHPDSPLTGRWAGSTRKANTKAVLAEIEDAAREAMAQRVRDGDTRPLQGRGRGGGGAGAGGAGKPAAGKPAAGKPAPSKP
ncbi:MAG: PA4780 family RIO1-like protein kinase, partial [Myxococcota bacterium]